MTLSPLGFAAMAARLGQLAEGRVVYALEGGYKPSVAARCTLAVLRMLVGKPNPHPNPNPNAYRAAHASR